MAWKARESSPIRGCLGEYGLHSSDNAAVFKLPQRADPLPQLLDVLGLAEFP